jgi:hypothetical protein
MRCWEIIAVYSQNLKKPHNTVYGENGMIINAKAGGI